MPELLETDRYDPTRNAFKFCQFCKDPAWQSVSSVEVGRCQRHSQIYSEDVKSGFKANRLKTLIDAYHAGQTT